VLAPSNHNAQPWRFVVDGTSVLLCADRTRALAVVDPFDRRLIIACGAALFNLRVAIQHFGLRYTITLFPDRFDPDCSPTSTYRMKGCMMARLPPSSTPCPGELQPARHST